MRLSAMSNKDNIIIPTTTYSITGGLILKIELIPNSGKEILRFLIKSTTGPNDKAVSLAGMKRAANIKIMVTETEMTGTMLNLLRKPAVFKGIASD